ENITLQASATDPNADPLQYLWSSSAGRIEGGGRTAALSASSLGTLSVGSQVTVTLTVKNSQGQQASRELVLNLKAPSTVSPEALIGRAIPLGSGIEVWLEGRTVVETGAAASGSIEADLEKRENVWHV